jgi:hypothetical protein
MRGPLVGAPILVKADDGIVDLVVLDRRAGPGPFDSRLGQAGLNLGPTQRR